MRKSINIPDTYWYIAAILGCILPPLGWLISAILYFFELKYSVTTKKTILYSGIGCIIYALSLGSYTAGVSLMINSNILLSLIFCLALIEGFLLVIFHSILKRKSKRFSKILFLAKNEHITSIPLISEISGYSKKEIASAIKKLAKIRVLFGAAVNQNQTEIIFSSCVWAKKKVYCTFCNAELIVNFGHTLICEYCGNPLKLK